MPGLCTVLGISSLSLGLGVSLLLLLLLNDVLIPVPPTPTLLQRWWGAGERKPGTVENTSLIPFTVSVEEQQLVDLRARIRSDLTRLSLPVEDSSFKYGFNTEYLGKLGRYWMDGFDWRAQERLLNSFPQFTTEIDGLTVHFIRVTPNPTKGQVVVPLLLVHGWPGSVIEFLDILPLLAKGDDRVCLEIVAPSIPGYGYSSAPRKEGFNSKEAAGIFHKLMLRLGHDKFIAQGGDWGSFITTTLATMFPHTVMGLHLNMAGVVSKGDSLRLLLASLPGMTGILVDNEDRGKAASLGSQVLQLIRESGYFHIQSTKPDTVGVGLSNSPLGLAAYIMEKFSTWTDPGLIQKTDGGLGGLNIPRDRILANVMVYWMTNSITSSMRFYKENFPPDQDISAIPLSIPVGYADFPNELIKVPRTCMLGKFPNLIQFTRMPSGGHFGAMEEPVRLSADIITFVRKVVTGDREKTEL